MWLEWGVPFLFLLSRVAVVVPSSSFISSLQFVLILTKHVIKKRAVFCPFVEKIEHLIFIRSIFCVWRQKNVVCDILRRVLLLLLILLFTLRAAFVDHHLITRLFKHSTRHAFCQVFLLKGHCGFCVATLDSLSQLVFPRCAPLILILHLGSLTFLCP